MESPVISDMSPYSLSPGSKVLVTGASGFTGAVLVRRLLAAGAEVRAIARHSSNLKPFEDLKIRWFRGDNFSRGLVEEAAHDVEYVFNLAAAYRDAGISDEMYRKVHVEGTQLLAKAVLKNAGLKRFVHVSTVGVHGHIENPPADENYPFAPGDIYQETKAEAERWFVEFARENNLPFTVIRPAAIYGPGDKRLLKVFKMAVRPLYPILGRGRCLYHLIYVEDLVTGLILAAAHPAALGEIFICGNCEPTCLEEMTGIIAAVLGRRTRAVRVPVWPFYIAGAVCEAICVPLGLRPPIYRRRVAFFTKDRAFNTAKIRTRLGFNPRFSNAGGLSETALWYREQGWI